MACPCMAVIGPGGALQDVKAPRKEGYGYVNLMSGSPWLLAELPLSRSLGDTNYIEEDHINYAESVEYHVEHCR